MARRRALSRRKKSALFVIGVGALVGLGAAFVLPLIRRRFQQPTITIPGDEITVKPSLSAWS